MKTTHNANLTDLIDRVCVPLHGDPHEYNDLLDAVGDRSFVLLGEASHGTREFYRERAAITRRLIEEQGFTAVAIEGDWPDAYRVNRYVGGASEDATAEAALADFHRFPARMWRNREVVEFVEWLRSHNASVTPERRVRFYGLDLYSCTPRWRRSSPISTGSIPLRLHVPGRDTPDSTRPIVRARRTAHAPGCS